MRKQVNCIFPGCAGWKCQSRMESLVLIPSSFAYLGYDLAQTGAKGLTRANAALPASTILILFLFLPKLIHSHNGTSSSYKSILAFCPACNSNSWFSSPSTSLNFLSHHLFTFLGVWFLPETLFPSEVCMGFLR